MYEEVRLPATRTDYPLQNHVPSRLALGGGHEDDQLRPREAWNVILRNRTVIFFCFGLAILFAVVFTRMVTPIYQAQTSIQIDDKPGAVQGITLSPGGGGANQLGTEVEVLRSRTLAEDVAEQLQLQLRLDEPHRVSRSAIMSGVKVLPGAKNGIYELRRIGNGRFRLTGGQHAGGTYAVGETISTPDFLFQLLPEAAGFKQIQFSIISKAAAAGIVRGGTTIVRPTRDANLLTVRYRSPDPRLATDVSNVLSTRFILRRQQVQKTEARSTVKFLHEQLDSLTTQLAASENALQAFREREQIVDLPAEAGMQVSRLASLQGDKTELEVERNSLLKLMQQVNSEERTKSPEAPSPFRKLLSLPVLLKSGVASGLLSSLMQAEDARADLLTRRTLADPDVQALTARIHGLENQLKSETMTYVNGLQSQEAAVDAAIGRLGGQLQEIPAREVQYARLARKPKVLEEIFALLQSRLKEAEITQAIEDPSVQVIDSALVPTSPVFPRPDLNYGAAAVIGLLIGLGVAFLREQLDNSVHTREDIQKATNVPVLGLIPRIRLNGRKTARIDGVASVIDRFPYISPWWHSRASRKVVSGGGTAALVKKPARVSSGSELYVIASDDPKSPVSEAYRGLRTNITFARPDDPARVLVFTSPMPGDGKTTSAANLAITLAQQGLKVLLVDADLRKGVLHTVFQTPREPGLSNVLIGGIPLEQAVARIDLGESGSLDLLSTGPHPPNPAELLGSAKMRDFLVRVQGVYNMVIFDTPPLNVVTDAAVLGSNASGVLLVARAAVTTREGLAFAMEQLQHVRASVLGAILNDIDFNRDVRYYGAYAAYGYYQYYQSA